MATEDDLEGLVERIEPKAGSDTPMLPDALKSALREVAAGVRRRMRAHRGRGSAATGARGSGTCVLFRGPAGTGKTMAAEVLALALGLDLYRIDLSAVAAKYIGETEKNLQRIIDEAEHSNALLFFDEADALFGKRSQVHDAHDRFTHVQIDRLLRRIEAYEPLAVLALTSMTDLDGAFLRRLRVIVDFPVPGDSQRPSSVA